MPNASELLSRQCVTYLGNAKLECRHLSTISDISNLLAPLEEPILQDCTCRKVRVQQYTVQKVRQTSLTLLQKIGFEFCHHRLGRKWWHGSFVVRKCSCELAAKIVKLGIPLDQLHWAGLLHDGLAIVPGFGVSIQEDQI